MLCRKFGNTEYNVSEIGFGTWPLAGGKDGYVAYGTVDERESKRALQAAYDSGITLFDTADFYGFGYVETLLGEVFNTVRDNVVLITKVGMTSTDGAQDFSTDYMVMSIENSLKRLRTDYIDVYMLHSPSLDILKDGRIISLLEIFKLEGKIKEFGISLRGPADGFRAITEFNFNIMEFNYNVVDQRAKHSGLFELCRKKNVATIIRTPLGQGLLPDEFKYNNDAADRRNTIPHERYTKVNSVYAQMLEHIKDKSVTPAQVALQYCLSEEAVSCVIPGMKTVNEVAENSVVSALGKLSIDELEAVNMIYNERMGS